MKVYSPKDNYKLDKILAASALFNGNIQVEYIDYDSKITKQFREAYPHYDLPVLQVTDHKYITGTNSILLYLCGESFN